MHPVHAQTRDLLVQVGDDLRVAVHQDHLGGASRARFQSQRATAGKQVQAASAGHIPRKPVEQGFPHPIRGGAQARHRGEIQFATAPAPGDEAHLVGAARHHDQAPLLICSPITPSTIKPRLSPLNTFQDSPNHATPMAAITAVPTADQMA